MRKLLLLLPVLCMLMAPMAKADDVWTMAQSSKYSTKAGGMLGRGLLNIATCFVDLVVATVEGTKNGPPVIGTITGLGKGIGCTALRVLSGALDVVTFWVPGFNGFPVCKSYKDCIMCDQPAAAAPMPAAPQPVYQAPPPPQPTIVEAPAPAPSQDESPMKYIKK